MQLDKKALLEWHIEAGADESIGDAPINRLSPAAKEPGYEPAPEAAPTAFQEQPKPAVKLVAPSPAILASPAAAMSVSRETADRCQTLAELEAAVREFEGCALKKTAGKTVFADGNPHAKVMIIGEAPGVQEDAQGIPFCGPSGMLLDKMLASIGLSRSENAYISNTVFWRPPGNRTPSPEETAICLPFVEKHIALVNPALLILAGGVATTTLLQKDQSISRLRGKLYDYANPYLSKPIPTLLTYHPSYLLRSPAQKSLAWQDLLMAKQFLKTNNIIEK